jgi:hypothetical protein
MWDHKQLTLGGAMAHEGMCGCYDGRLLGL